MKSAHKATLITLFLTTVGVATAFFPKSENQLAAKAARLHERILTIDSHCDTPLNLLDNNYNICKRHNPRNGGGKVDLPRMKEGNLDASFFAVFVGQGPRTRKGNQQAKEKALEIFHAIHKTVKECPQWAALAYSPSEAYKLEKEGKRAIFLGIENGYPIGQDLSLIKTYYDLGARYITLCHSRNNDICDSSTDPKGPEHGGLSDFGKEVIKEMNKLGIMIDVSHISDQSFYDAIKYSKTPVIASHSCARAICDHPRNMSDEMIKALTAKGGVIQVCILGDYLKKIPNNPQRDSAQAILRKKYNNFKDLSQEQMKNAHQEWQEIKQRYPRKLATVKDLVNHIDHIVNLVGIDFVGIGTDFDGGSALADCYDVSQVENITLELVKRGYSDRDIEKIWGANLIRVFRKVQSKKAEECKWGVINYQVFSNNQ